MSCEHAGSVSVGCSDSTDDISDVNALIGDVRAITPAIRPLGYRTVLFTCPCPEQGLINVNSIA